MSKCKRIAIVLSDTLHRMGLHSLLTEYFSPVNIVHCSTVNEILGRDENFDLFFTSYENYVLGLDYFLLRKSKTYILSDTDTVVKNSNLLPLKASVDTLIECLQPIMENVVTPSSARENKNLSARETDVLKQVVKGETNKEIAEILNISLNTVLSHRKNITAKLGIKTVPGLTFYAIINGIITGEEI